MYLAKVLKSQRAHFELKRTLEKYVLFKTVSLYVENRRWYFYQAF